MDKLKKPRSRKRRLFYPIKVLVLLLLLLPMLAMQIDLWWLDNLLNLQLQWSLLAALLIIINLTYVKKWRFISSGLFCGLIFFNLSPLYLTTSGASIAMQKRPPAVAVTLTIAQLNLSYDNPNLQQLLPLLGNHHFDLLVIQEASDKEHKKISALAKYYPYSFGLSKREATPSGMAIFSRWPISERNLHDLGYKSGHILEIVMQVGPMNTPIQLFTLHPGSPRNSELWQQRNQTLLRTANIVADSPFHNKIVIGDFNSSPWSSTFQQFQQTSGLKNSAQGFGYLPTWSYSNNPILSLLSSVYIDHHLVSDNFVVLNKRTQQIAGSDHLMVITQLAM